MNHSLPTCHREFNLAVINLLVDQNYVPAITRLAMCYESGFGVPYDLLEATRLYEKAAELGSVKGALCAAKFYLKVNDGARAHKLLLPHKNHVKVALELGKIYCYGVGVPSDIDLARAHFLQSAVLGDPEALFFEAWFEVFTQPPPVSPEALSALLHNLRNDTAQKCLLIWRAYNAQLVDKQDFRLIANRALQLASQGSYLPALCDKWTWFLEEYSGPDVFTLALEVLGQAADLGCDRAMAKLADFKLDISVRGEEVDDVVELCNRAMKRGFTPAEATLAVYFIRHTDDVMECAIGTQTLLRHIRHGYLKDSSGLINLIMERTAQYVDIEYLMGELEAASEHDVTVNPIIWSLIKDSSDLLAGCMTPSPDLLLNFWDQISPLHVNADLKSMSPSRQQPPAGRLDHTEVTSAIETHKIESLIQIADYRHLKLENYGGNRLPLKNDKEKVQAKVIDYYSFVTKRKSI